MAADLARLTRTIASAAIVVAVLGGPAAHAQNAEPNAAELAAFAPPIVSRAEWQAKPALPGMRPQTPNAIILHHTGEMMRPKTTLEAKLRGLQAFSQKPAQMSPGHTKPAWGDVPYHYYIDAAGRIGEGRDIRLAGDTNTGYDTLGYVQVVVEGNFDKEQPTPAQIEATRKLVVWLMLVWNVTPEKVSTHKDHGQTACPGRAFLAALPELKRSMVALRSQSIASLCGGTHSPAIDRLYCSAR